jgi:putative aminopeptidase FrvX
VRVEPTEQARRIAAAHLSPLMERIHTAIEATSARDLQAVAEFLRHLVTNDD